MTKEKGRVSSPPSAFRFIDLFAGIGGFRSGMTSVGGTCVFTSEWDRFAVETYKAWYKDVHVYDGDIRSQDRPTIPDHDVLCAGFPCQPFSLAGVSKKNSLGRAHGFDDVKQGNLFFSILDIIDAKKPPVIFLENVKNLMSHDKGQTWARIKTELEDRRYGLFTKVIDARHWVPQHRERIFIVGFREDVFGKKSKIDFDFPNLRANEQKTLDSILQKTRVPSKYMLSDKLYQYLEAYKEKHERLGNGFGCSVFDGKGVARTLSC